MGDLIKPDFKARRRKAKLLQQQERREELLFKLQPYIDLAGVVLVIGALVTVMYLTLR